MAKQKLQYIDALRGVAVLGVIMVHVSLLTLCCTSLSILGLGGKGVQLFYFISAFTLFLSANRRSVKENNPTRNFFLRRIFRIAPMYYLALIYYSILIPLINSKIIAFDGIFLNIAFIHGFSPTYINAIVPGGWSIGIEMLFYLFVPLLTLKINSFNKAVAFLFIALLIRFIFNTTLAGNPFNYDHNLWTNYLYWYLPNQLPAFAFGIIFYFVSIQTSIKEVFTQHRKTIAISSLALIVLLVADKGVFKMGFFNVDFFFSLSFLLIAIIISKYNFKIIVNQFTILVGKLSFSMYLIHFAVIHGVFQIIPVTLLSNKLANFAIIYLIVLLVSTALSYISYKFIELKMQEKGKILIAKLEGKQNDIALEVNNNQPLTNRS